MSTSLVTNIAFIVLIIFSYNLLKGTIRAFLRKRQKKKSIADCDNEEFQRRVNEYCKNIMGEWSTLEKSLNGIISQACEKVTSIAENSKKQLNKEFSDAASANMKSASDRIIEAVKESKAYTASVAAKVAEKLVEEHQDEKEVISSFSRDLNKKLH